MHPPAFRLDHRLSDWPECHLELRCTPCGGRSTAPAVKFLARQLGNPTFAALLARLRCHHCGAKPAPVHLCASYQRTFSGGPPPDWAIELVPAPRLEQPGP